MDRTWVDQVRQLLGKARAQHSKAFDDLQGLRASIDSALHAVEAGRGVAAPSNAAHVAPYPIRRAAAMAQARLKIKHYGMHDEAQAFILAAGVSSLNGLNADQALALDAWLAGLIDQQQHACDWSDAPPAR